MALFDVHKVYLVQDSPWVEFNAFKIFKA